MIKCKKHNYKGHQVPDFVVNGGQVMSLFTPIIGNNNRSFFLKNDSLVNDSLFFIDSFLPKSPKTSIKPDHGQYNLAFSVAEKINLGTQNALDIIAFNFLSHYDNYTDFVLFTAGLGFEKVKSLYKMVFEIVSNDNTKCALIIENPTIETPINEIKSFILKKEMLISIPDWHMTTPNYQ